MATSEKGRSSALFLLPAFILAALLSDAAAQDDERNGHYFVEVNRFTPLSRECRAFVAAANVERERFLARPIPGMIATEPLPLRSLLGIQGVEEPAWQVLEPSAQEYLIRRILEHLDRRPAYWALQYAYFFDPGAVRPEYSRMWQRLQVTWGRLDDSEKARLTDYVLRAYRAFSNSGGRVRFLKATSPNSDNIVQFDRPADARPLNDIPGIDAQVIVNPVVSISVDATDIDQLKPSGAKDGFHERYLLFDAKLFRVAQRSRGFIAWRLERSGIECSFYLAP